LFPKFEKEYALSRLLALKEKIHSLHLLYVEDDTDSREQLTVALEMIFESVTVASDGKEGLNHYRNGHFDIVITDINMSRMDGIEMTHAIKDLDPNQKIILISAHNNSDYLISAIREGVDGFILKPIEMNQLIDVVDKLATSIQHEKLQIDYQKELESQVQRKTADLIRQMYTDDLTSLSNRKKLVLDLKTPESKTLVLINIDNFDNINAAYGYYNGDSVLIKFADFLNKHKRLEADLYRIGNDEFCFLFRNMEFDKVKLFAKHLQKEISQTPCVHDKTTIRYTTTIVIAYGEEGDLLKNADLAFKQARRIGKNRIGIYTPESDLEARLKHIQECTQMLSHAIEKRAIIPHFHAIIDNETRKISKFECLARMIYNGTLIYPSSFIETAEMTGMLPDITRLMVESSFTYFKDRDEEFSINISEYDLNDGYLEEFLDEQIRFHQIDPSRVVLEVLEGISAHGAEKSIEQLLGFKERGFRLAIDDFGAQNSNFERVLHLQVDYIKIDGRFIKQIDHDFNSFQIAKTITDFSHGIGAKVIAEFVHSPEVLAKVLELGIEYSQGFLFAKPEPHCNSRILY
jgi:diguanylate cyclase